VRALRKRRKCVSQNKRHTEPFAIGFNPGIVTQIPRHETPTQELPSGIPLRLQVVHLQPLNGCAGPHVSGGPGGDPVWVGG
jgi:hypothetical protein